MDTNGKLVPQSNDNVTGAIEIFGDQISSYLESMGLPANDILTPVNLRRPIFQNMDTALDKLTIEQKSKAVYISKFSAACAVGLFDAALNYLWNETVKDLRNKVSRFDIVYFFDITVGDSAQREKLKNESDLEKLPDWQLIRGCHEIGIITEVGFQHLDYIRNMRNHASAAHPNQVEITGLQLSSWLETCIREVLSNEPNEPAIKIRALLNNLRQERISESGLPAIEAGLDSLPETQADSLLRAILGMYATPDISSQVKDNIRIIAKSVWKVVSDEVRQEIGVKQAIHEANGDTTKSNLIREFIEVVDGLEYLTEVTRSAEISAALDNLMTAHEGWNNFYTEVAPARLLQRIVPGNGDIPVAVISKYVKVITMCRIGNGYGVSWDASDYYDELLARFQDVQIRSFINLLYDPEIISRLQFPKCARAYQSIVTTLIARAVRPRVKETLAFIEQYPTDRLKNVKSDDRFLTLRQSLQV